MGSRVGKSRVTGGGRSAAIVLGALGALLATVGVAIAAGGLLNPSFENDLDHWSVKTTQQDSNRTTVYGPGGTKGEVVPCVPGDERRKRYGICVVGEDTFPVVDNNGERDQTVTPLDGGKMVRLAGPFNADWQRQASHDFVLEQSFTVDPDNPVVQVSFNYFSFDYTGFDELEFLIKLTDENGDVIDRAVQRGFGSGTDLKTTGWRTHSFDLTSFAGQSVDLELINRGTSDSAFGTWSYIDAGVAPQPPITGADVEASAPSLPGGGSVNLNQYTDPGGGQTYFTIPNSQVSQFPNGEMPLTIDVPINPGGGTVSNVNLFLAGNSVPMSNLVGNTWRGVIDAVESGALSVEYDLTEDGVTQHFVVPIGGIVLIDPQGVVYDQVEFDAAKATGKTDAEARAIAAIEGASVELQRRNADPGVFVKVLSGDPGIAPNVNPLITGDDGFYQWDVSEGRYRVVVTKSGYETVTSNAVDIPPPVLDHHIAMTPIGGGGTTTTTTPPPTTTTPTTTTTTTTTTPTTTTTTTTTTPPPNDAACEKAKDQRKKAQGTLKKAKAKFTKAKKQLKKAQGKKKVKKAKAKVKKAKSKRTTAQKKVKKAKAKVIATCG